MNIQRFRAVNSRLVAWSEFSEPDVLLVGFQVLLKKCSSALRIYVAGLLDEMKQQPQFEAWVGHRDTNILSSRQPLSRNQTDVLIDIEHAPDFVVLQVVITLTPGTLGGIIPECRSSLDERLRVSTRRFHMNSDRICPVRDAKPVEVFGFRNDTLTHDEQQRHRLP